MFIMYFMTLGVIYYDKNVFKNIFDFRNQFLVLIFGKSTELRFGQNTKIWVNLFLTRVISEIKH